jgi:PEP-CTERM motif
VSLRWQDKGASHNGALLHENCFSKWRNADALTGVSRPMIKGHFALGTNNRGLMMRAFAFLTLAGGILATAPVPASAAQIVEDFTISISGSTDQDFEGTSFMEFDPSFGTLMSIQESVTGSATWLTSFPGETLILTMQLTARSQVFFSSATGGASVIQVNMNGVSNIPSQFEGTGSLEETLFSRQSPGADTFSPAVLDGTITYNFTPPTGVSVGSAVPEPSTWGMMLIGFAGLGYAAVRRKGARRPVSA